MGVTTLAAAIVGGTGPFDGEYSPLTYGIELEVEADREGLDSGYMPEETRDLEVCYTDPRTGSTEYTYVEIDLPEIEDDDENDPSGPLASALSRHNWEVRNDSSLESHHGGRMAECVSPVLVGPEGLCSVDDALGPIDRWCQTNPSCGMHVHVGYTVPDLALDFRALVPALDETFGVFEAAFYAMAGRGARRRMDSDYCRPKRPGDNRERYRSLNLTNVGGGWKPTVEVRAFGPTTDADDVKGAVALSVGIASWVFSGVAGVTAFPNARIDDPREAMDRLLAAIDMPGFLPFDDPDEKEEIFGHCRMRAAEAARSLGFA